MSAEGLNAQSASDKVPGVTRRSSGFLSLLLAELQPCASGIMYVQPVTTTFVPILAGLLQT